MKTNKLLRYLSNYYPKRYAKMNHDFVGLMVEPLPKEIKRIVLCLDMDNQILDEVISLKPDMVLTHHPFFFGKKRFILEHDPLKKECYEKLKENNICVYSMHTNFDTGRCGMNDALCEALNLKNIRSSVKNEMMRIGELDKEMEIHEFATFAKKAFDVEYGLLINEGKKYIKTVGIIGGGGSRSFMLAKEEGCDIYISGDAPHYLRRDVILNNYNYLDFPHEIERIFMKQMKKMLLKADDTLEVITIDHEKRPEVI